RWPGKVRPGSTTDAMVEYTDIVPTFVEAAGGSPASKLDWKSFVKVLTGQTDHHKDYSFGEMTTRGIINGSDSFAIRTVRGLRYRLIWNLNHETKFTNACTSADYFQSMIEAAESGNETARYLVDRYQHRPEFELFDCQNDPLELDNLIDDPKYLPVVRRLKTELDQWMEAQGDLGLETELDALAHQGRYKGMTRQAALDLWRAKKQNKKKSQKNRK
ncbi:MAG: DUF4976 domain-containing protein, partial [Pirellulales bacterium]|nr:DUF4976 domain-containing protein [Pirellulales bacterium]